ncbi:MAG: PBP1A family penicillin-binding protein [Patescibacteria group bacterium]
MSISIFGTDCFTRYNEQTMKELINNLKQNWVKNLGLAILIGAGLFSVWLLALTYNLPSPEGFDQRIINQSTKILDRTGKTILYEVHGEEKRTVVSFDQIPEIMKQATLAAEDAEFYSHPAFDIKSMFRGLFINPIFRGTSVQGGSTITQQLVKNVFLTPERTVARKIKELILAIKLEKKYSKDQILEFYLNQIPYGSNAYGIESASQTFFNKPVAELNLAEAALLASLPKAPSLYSPYGSHTDKLKQRQEYILDRMTELNWIAQEQADQAKQEKLNFPKQRFPIKAPHFVFYVRSLLEEMYDPQLIETGGLNVQTTLDWELQQIAEQAVYDGALRNDQNWHADNAALLAQDPKTGEILAMVGSRDWYNLEKNGQANVALLTRQPGSAFKPFVYLKAFEKGYTPETILFDAWTEFNTGCNLDPALNPSSCYHPQNYDNQFRGPVSLRKALAQSLNVPSVKLLYLVGIKDAIETAKSFGITTLTENPNYYGLSLILGGGGVRLIDMVQAYSVFANDGLWRKQTAILKITDSQGNVLYENKPEQKQVFEGKYIRVLNNVLSDDLSRTPTFQLNGPLTVPGYQVAAKTGTSQDYIDAWTFGYSPNLVAGVWVGNNEYKPMQRDAAGGMAAAPIWNDFMKQALTHFPKENFPPAEPLPAPKPILSGQYLINSEIHNILHWLDKNNPLGPQPINPQTDPQYNYWEFGLQKWLSQNPGLINQTPDSSNPSIILLEPKENTKIKPNQSLKISFKLNPNILLEKVELYFNQSLVVVFQPNEQNLYSVFFVPSELNQTNKILIKAITKSGDVSELEKELFSE